MLACPGTDAEGVCERTCAGDSCIFEMDACYASHTDPVTYGGCTFGPGNHQNPCYEDGFWSCLVETATRGCPNGPLAVTLRSHAASPPRPTPRPPLGRPVVQEPAAGAGTRLVREPPATSVPLPAFGAPLALVATLLALAFVLRRGRQHRHGLATRPQAEEAEVVLVSTT